jgi:alpha-tubulin suppressor-like RCC1 family protein
MVSNSGYNGLGQLGLGDTANRSSPVQVGALTTWYQIAVGNQHALATKTDGTLWSWGNGFNGQLGQNAAGPGTYRSSPVQVGLLTTWSKIAGGRAFSLAVKTDGTLWSWGYNIYGNLGFNDTANRSSPVQVGALTTWLTLPKMPVSSAPVVIKG